jgi:hypothetical protein
MLDPGARAAWRAEAEDDFVENPRLYRTILALLDAIEELEETGAFRKPNDRAVWMFESSFRSWRDELKQLRSENVRLRTMLDEAKWGWAESLAARNEADR